MLHKPKAWNRLLLCASLAVALAVILPEPIRWQTRILGGWILGLGVFLGVSWRAMASKLPKEMRQSVQSEDVAGPTFFVTLVVGACVSLLAITYLLPNAMSSLKPAGSVEFQVGLAVLAIAGSWLLMHTAFALHYAHRFYTDEYALPTAKTPGGLDFPDEDDPDYWDFAYFAFVIGMTSQVSDVRVTSRSMRRLSLTHSVLSFVFNTVIVAMSVNVIAGLI
ncbi:MAG: DUF1345 domain-containing protein [Gemmatimonadaceae bacterium]|nr:DUF1345 domain-containing protein [Gloeobacterales cyanobacterium ES-bin-141]